MATDDGSQRAGRPRRAPPSYLPYLTGALLTLLFVWFLVWFFFQRPSTEEQLQIVALRTALEYIPRRYVEEVDRKDVYQAGMRGMVDSLGDKYSSYVTPPDTRRIRQATEGEFGGIGVVITARDGSHVIVEVSTDGPAAGTAIQVGDVITHVDGEDVSELSLWGLVEKVRGEVGTEVELALRRPATGESFALTLTRATITLQNVKWEMMADDIAYLELASFDLKCGDEVEQALGEMKEQGARALIIDLRGNVGGLVQSALRVADMFLAGGTIVSVKKRDSVTAIDADPSVALEEDVPVVVLVDHTTASASEILSGALQANGRATVLGRRTHGKGSMTELLPLPDGSAVNLTTGRYQLAGGQVVEGEGIQPDIVVGELPDLPGEGPGAAEQWIEQYEHARQLQLERAVEVLKGKLAQE